MEMKGDWLTRFREGVGGLPGQAVTLLATLVSVLLLPQAVAELCGNIDLQGAIALLIFGVYTIYLLVRVNQVYLAWGRDRRYAHVFKVLNRGFSHLHNAIDENGDGRIDLKEGRVASEVVCDSVAEAMSHVTSTRCAACVKLIAVAPDEPGRRVAVTFARDAGSRRDRAFNDQPEHLHHIDSNTAFQRLIASVEHQDGVFFIHDDVSTDPEYENTSIANYQRRDGTENRWAARRSWPLPYKSVLVVPITPNIADSRPRPQQVAGFLCIDSPGFRAFKIEHDVALAQGVADGLYNLIRDMNQDFPASEARGTAGGPGQAADVDHLEG